MLKNDEKMTALATVTAMMMLNDWQDSSSTFVQTLGACAIGLGATVGVLLSTMAKEFCVKQANPGHYQFDDCTWRLTGFLDGDTADKLEKDVKDKLNNALQQKSLVFDFSDSPRVAGLFTTNFERMLVEIVKKWKSDNPGQSRSITIKLPEKSWLSGFSAATSKIFNFVVTVLLGLKMFVMPTSKKIFLEDLESVTPPTRTIMPFIRWFLCDWSVWLTMGLLAVGVSLQNNIDSQMETVRKKAYVDAEIREDAKIIKIIYDQHQPAQVHLLQQWRP